MKYDLYEVLRTNGYEKQEDDFWDIISKKYEGLYDSIKVVALFDRTHSVVTLKYYAGGCKREFKSKTHLNEKRAYNALMATLRNNYVKEIG